MIHIADTVPDHVVSSAIAVVTGAGSSRAGAAAAEILKASGVVIETGDRAKKGKRCVHPGCMTWPAFDYPGGKGRFCAEHKLNGMVDVKNKRCEGKDGETCMKRPNFDAPGGKGRFCAEHKLKGMVDVKNKRCEGKHDDGTPCTKINPVFDVPGGKGQFCAEHKLDDMVDVKHTRCEGKDGETCMKRPNFDVPGGKGRFCAEHKLDGMVDVKHTRCEGKHDDGTPCTKINPKFDIPGGKGRFCAEHKLKGMVDVKNTRCEGKHDDGTPCTKLNPNFDVPGGKGRYCAEHKLDDMMDVKNKRCASHMCDTFVTSKYDGYCIRCFIHLFPDKPVSRNYKIKEKHVTDYVKTVLEQDLSHLQAQYDKVIDGGCSRRRPDVLIDCFTHSIVIEVDENQHDTDEYCACENKRVMELFQDLGSRPLVMLRFNPDGYTDADGTKVPSCFAKLSKLEVMHVSKTQKKQWENRLETLRRYLLHHATTVPDREVTWEHLYYDDFFTSL